jgi:hypothetical protein
MSYTPGPYDLTPPSGEGDYAVLDQSGYILAEFYYQAEVDKFRPALANARLFMAAEKLLAACKEAREKITGIEDVFDDLAQVLDIAIAEARAPADDIPSFCAGCGAEVPGGVVLCSKCVGN